VAGEGWVGRRQFARGVRQRLTLLGEVGVDKALVIPSRNEADLLRVRLFRQRQPMLPGELAHLGLAHVAQRKESAAELLLGKTEEEISLVLARIGGAAQNPAI